VLEKIPLESSRQILSSLRDASIGANDPAVYPSPIRASRNDTTPAMSSGRPAAGAFDRILLGCAEDPDWTTYAHAPARWSGPSQPANLGRCIRV